MTREDLKALIILRWAGLLLLLALWFDWITRAEIVIALLYFILFALIWIVEILLKNQKNNE